jgi:hypothetical protein
MAVRQTRNTITNSLGQVRRRFSTLPKLAYQHWRKVTPKRSGNARKKTKLQRDVIVARYPYAKRLDEGWSKQARRGMFQPTFEFIKRTTRRMLRKI